MVLVSWAAGRCGQTRTSTDRWLVTSLAGVVALHASRFARWLALAAGQCLPHLSRVRGSAGDVRTAAAGRAAALLLCRPRRQSCGSRRAWSPSSGAGERGGAPQGFSHARRRVPRPTHRVGIPRSSRTEPSGPFSRSLHRARTAGMVRPDPMQSVWADHCLSMGPAPRRLREADHSLPGLAASAPKWT